MPSDIMDQRHMPSFYRPSVPSSFFTEENRFPSERQVGFWKNGSVPDLRGLETMSYMPGSKIVSPSPLEKLRQAGGNFVDSLELPHNLFKDAKRNINFEHHLMGTENTANGLTAPGQDVASLSKFYGQRALAENAALNEGHYETGLFSSSLSDILNKKLRLGSNDIFVGQSVEATQPNFVEDEVSESLEEIEAQAIGDLLPDDDDLLSGAHDLGYFAQTNKADAEEDLFCSLGGMELESDDNFSSKKISDHDDLTFNGQCLPASELPCGEHPTRTLFVKNIASIDDMELRVLFEQFGDIQTLFTACRSRGFIMVSYFDIRAAQNAIRVLQTKSIRHQKLDIHFCVPKDNLSEIDINLGALVVTNLDSSISNDDLLRIFSAYGQIKEICGIPNKQHLKFIEFYDVQAAEAALLDLNRHGVAGNKIKVEPCCPGDASSIRQVALDFEEEQSNGCRQPSYSSKLPSECFVPSGLITLGANTTSSLHNGANHGMHSAFDISNGSCIETKYHGIPSSSGPQSFSSPTRVAMVGSRNIQSGDCELSYSLGRSIGFQSMPTFPEFHDGGVISGNPFNSSSTMSAMGMNINSSLANGIDNRTIHRVGSAAHSSHSFEQNEAAYSVLGNGSCSLNGHEYIWNNSNTHRHHHPGSFVWQNLPPFIAPQATQVHGLTGGHISNPVLTLQQHAGSAPSVDPSLFDGQHTYSGDGASFHPSSLGSIGYSSCSPVHALELASHNLFRHAAGNYTDPSVATPHVGIPSPQQRGHIFRGRNNANSMLASHETPTDRIRSRRHDPSANQADNRKQYELDIDHIIRGEDSRTTLMIKNIPNKYTSKMLLATIDEQHKGTYDFIYLPIDFKNKCNVGYAFINMTDPQHIIPFYQSFNGKKWEKFNSEKVASLAYARIQGKAALVAHFQNSSLMNEDKRCRPILFHSDGPNAGDQEPFPMGVNIRSRRSRTNMENHQGSPSGSSSEEESSNVVGSPSGSPQRTLNDHAIFSKAI